MVCPSGMTRTLELDCKGYEALSFIQWIVGLGRPLAVQLKVASGSLDLQQSQVSGHLQIDTKRINMNEWDVMNCLICDLSLGWRGPRLFLLERPGLKRIKL